MTNYKKKWNNQKRYLLLVSWDKFSFKKKSFDLKKENSIK